MADLSKVAPPESDTDGRHADSPWQMPLAAWKHVAVRTWREATEDNVGLVAAGVAFYGFLALVPSLGAIVLIYGLVAEPSAIANNARSLTAFMPTEAAQLIGDQLENVIKTSDGKKGLGLLLAVGLALFGARNAAGSIISALNIAYEEEERRSFVRLNLLTLAITATGIVVAIVALIAIAAFGHIEALLPKAPPPVLAFTRVFAYLLFATAAAAAAATLYRYGPDRNHARWVWLTPGSAAATILWMAFTLVFGVYVANFGNYNATYGSLGAVMVLLTWLYLSSYVLLLGAELNAELEHQTARDSTVGKERPLGQRDASMADTVADPPAPKTDLSSQSTDLRPPAADARRSAMAPAVRDYVVSRAIARGIARKGRVTVSSSALATVGLALLRKQDRALSGVAAITLAGLLAWRQRDHGDAAG